MSKLTTLADASKMTKDHRDENSGMPQAHTFEADHILSVLKQPGCTGLRIYHGKDANNSASLLAVGTDANNNDILPATNALIVSNPFPCPPQCAPNSPDRK